MATYLNLRPTDSKCTFASGLSYPQGLAFDSAGNLFVAQWGSSGKSTIGSIIMITPGGVQSTLATGLSNPDGLAFDSAGDLFEADLGSGNIYEFIKTNGILSSSPTLFATLYGPQGLVFDSPGNLYVADANAWEVYVFTNSNGTLSTNPTLFASELVNPWGLAFDNEGNLFIANCRYGELGTGYITEQVPSGAQTKYATVTAPNELALNTAGDLFVASGSGGMNRVVKIAADGTQSTLGSGFRNPVGIAFYPTPQLLAAITNGIFQVTVSNPSYYYSTIIQASTDMLNWGNIYTNTPPFTFTDSNTSQLDQRYYRSLLAP